jgi:hypothetical protein
MRSLARVRPLLSLEVPADQQVGFHDASTNGEHRLDDVLVRRLATASSGRPPSLGVWALSHPDLRLPLGDQRVAVRAARAAHDVVQAKACAGGEDGAA